MQLTFTVGRDTSPAEYHRLIAALIVLGDVEVPEASVQGELLLPERYVGKSPELAAPYGTATIEEMEAEARPVGAVVGVPPTPPPPPAPPVTPTEPENVDTSAAHADGIDTTTLGFGADPGCPKLGALIDQAETLVGSTPPPPLAPAAADPDVDAHGVRYDADIHTAKRSKNGDGGWRLKPGVDKGLVERKLVEQKRVAELPVSTPDGGVLTALQEQRDAQQTPPPPPPPAAPAAAPAPPPPPPAPTATPTTPAELFKWATGAGKTPSECKAAALAVGLVNANGEGDIALLLSRPDAVPSIYAALGGVSG